MLRFAEEMTLLLLDDDGRFQRVPTWSLNYALAGGVLMDLALEYRIDTDLDKLTLIDSTPLGDNLLDSVLADIAASEEEQNARYWIERTAARGEAILQESLSRLMNVGILESRDDRFMWVFRSRRYPAIDGKVEREVKLRIMEVLFSEEVPDPRDIVIISLAHACGIFTELLSSRELETAAPRIDQVRKLDLIGQAMTKAIRDIEMSIATSLHPQLY